ncbi:hypothetical protein SESBI_41114 [Sesbania bispinosa]|nr:hypothetical protein SESBI_41114 [Sesbania bispinosa]
MENLTEEKKQSHFSDQASNSNMWDCGSTLYDSFELNSFKRQLDSAIANSHRTLSMSRLPERRVLLPLQPEQQTPSTRKPFKITRSFQKFIRSVFKSNNKSNTTTSNFQVADNYYTKERFYVVYDKSGPVLSTIPEVPEFEISPEISSLVRRSASERFTATKIAIACA